MIDPGNEESSLELPVWFLPCIRSRDAMAVLESTSSVLLVILIHSQSQSGTLFLSPCMSSSLIEWVVLPISTFALQDARGDQRSDVRRPWYQ